MSGLVRARGLKHYNIIVSAADLVRARKSPWIETAVKQNPMIAFQSGLVRARGLKHYQPSDRNCHNRQGS